MIDIISPSPLALTLSEELVADRHPAHCYLARLGPSSRRSTTQALHNLAGLLSDGEATAFTLNWAALRSEHIVVLCARLAERYTVATANKMLSALGGVLLEAYLLGQIAVHDYHSAINITPVWPNASPRDSACDQRARHSLKIVLRLLQPPTHVSDRDRTINWPLMNW